MLNPPTRGIVHSEPQPMTGWFLKLNKRGKFQRRFLVVEGYFLSYYKDSSDFIRRKAPCKQPMDLRELINISVPSENHSAQMLGGNRSIDLDLPYRKLTVVVADRTHPGTEELFCTLQGWMQGAGYHEGLGAAGSRRRSSHVLVQQPIARNSLSYVKPPVVPPRFPQLTCPNCGTINRVPRSAEDGSRVIYCTSCGTGMVPPTNGAVQMVRNNSVGAPNRRSGSGTVNRRRSQLEVEEEERQLALALSKSEVEYQNQQKSRRTTTLEEKRLIEQVRALSMKDALPKTQREVIANAASRSASETRNRRATSREEQLMLSEAMAASQQDARKRRATSREERRLIEETLRRSEAESRNRRATSKEEERQISEALKRSASEPDEFAGLHSALAASRKEFEWIAAARNQPKGLDDDELLKLGEAASIRLANQKRKS